MRLGNLLDDRQADAESFPFPSFAGAIEALEYPLPPLPLSPIAMPIPISSSASRIPRSCPSWPYRIALSIRQRIFIIEKYQISLFRQIAVCPGKPLQ